MATYSPFPAQPLLEDLEALARPCCPEAQADGVPCPDAHSACEECWRARAALETVRDRPGLR